MKYSIKLEDNEVDAFVGIFVNGLIGPESGRTKAEKRVIEKVAALGTRYENALVGGGKP